MKRRAPRVCQSNAKSTGILAMASPSDSTLNGEGDDLDECHLSDKVTKKEWVQNITISQDEDIKQFDTSDMFKEVFGKDDRPSFDSWEELTSYVEEFQLRSGTSYKPKSSCKVANANERRTSELLPERFVYSSIKLICVHFGEAREGVQGKRKYVGLGCGAFFRASCSKGRLRISTRQLIHTNHDPEFKKEDKTTPRSRFQVFNFTEELDMVMLPQMVANNPFKSVRSERAWEKAIQALKDKDERFDDVTTRDVKKRIGFLLKQFERISKGRTPIAEDKMGLMLYQLYQSKNEVSVGTPRVRLSGVKRRVPSPAVDDDGDSPIEYDDTEDNGHIDKHVDSGVDVNKRLADSPVRKTRSRTRNGETSSTSDSGISPAPTFKSSSSSCSDIALFISYLKTKDEHDRRLRERELTLREKELEFHREQFEYDKKERTLVVHNLQKQMCDVESSLASMSATSTTTVQVLSPSTKYDVSSPIIIDEHGESQIVNMEASHS